MPVLGVSGLFSTELNDYDPATFFAFYHDATACLAHDGVTLAAMEEERFNRDKHTNRFPGNAIRECVDLVGIKPEQISHIAYFFEEGYTDSELALAAANDPLMPLTPCRQQLCEQVSEVLLYDMSDVPIIFAIHHSAHAASAFYESGYESSLVIVSDGNGERDGISVFLGDDTGLRLLKSYPRKNSIGHFYTAITKMIGYRDFDEYKVMGLAAFGNPAGWREALEELYTLKPDGEYEMDHASVVSTLLKHGQRPRRSQEPLTQTHRDLAAAGQEALERIALHVIRYWLRATGERNLCIAGGVGQNTTLNGLILTLSGLDSVFIPSAPHDAGAALGAAMLVDREVSRKPKIRNYSRGPFQGQSLGTPEEIEQTLRVWHEFVDYRRPDGLEGEVARALADGAIVGWARGRAEFGPRALGNRSILADPRSAQTREKVNSLIKQREDYRPFAPVVLAPHAQQFFEFPAIAADYSYMGYVLDVRPDERNRLGAVTHVDGTARVQVLQEGQNDGLWKLIEEFYAITGVPVLLNTSFNNFAEPIVQSADDAIACFITAGLSLLIIGPYIVRSKSCKLDGLLNCKLELMPFCKVNKSVSRVHTSYTIARTLLPNETLEISALAASVLWERARVGDVVRTESEHKSLCNEVARLWDRRLVKVIPKATV